MVAGREATPKDAQDTERLKAYWTTGAGAAKINWGVPGDFDRCVTELSQHVGPDIVKGLCSNLHQRATGARPGHAPAEQAAHDTSQAAKKAGHRLVTKLRRANACHRERLPGTLYIGGRPIQGNVYVNGLAEFIRMAELIARQRAQQGEQPIHLDLDHLR